MKTANIIKTAVWIALLAGMSVAGIKYVAVVETGVERGLNTSLSWRATSTKGRERPRI